MFTDLSLKEDEDGGIEIGKFVLETRPHIPVLYTSGRPFTDGLSVLFIENSSFLPKPYTDDQVTAELAKLLDQQGHARERKTSER